MKSILTLNSYISPKLVRSIYWVGLVLIALSSLAGIYSALTFSGTLNYDLQQSGFISLLTVLLATIAAVIVWRVVVEVILVLFSIHELLRDIRNQAPPPPAPVYNRRSTDIIQS